MNKVKNIIRNSEIDTLSDTIIRFFKADKEAQKDAFLSSAIGELEELSEKITTASLQDKRLSTLETADGERNKAIKTLGTVLNGYAALPIESKKAQAVPLKAIFDKYAKGRITRESYAAKSSLIESMLQDFAAASLSTNISGLEGVAESIALIRTAQDDFAKANDDFLDASVNKGASATSFNKQIALLINEKLVPYLNAMLLTGNARCSDFAKNIEEEIRRINEAIAKRGSFRNSSIDK
ncbi:MAG: hypothetical protein J5798_03665 [Spirochaetaceae bacterium]|nr:hypothetical protein [Spirochaetaceae bacterium]